MKDKLIKELAFNIAKARLLCEKGDAEGSQMLLDRCSEIIPDKFWPTDAEVSQ